MTKLKSQKIDTIDVKSYPTMAHVVDERARIRPHDRAIEIQTELGGAWRVIRAKQLAQDVHHIARGLMGMGLKVGDTVGIMGGTSYNWTILDLGIQAAGLVSVPIYETDSADQIDWIVEDAGVKVIVCDTILQARTIEPVKQKWDHLESVLAIDDGGLEYIFDISQNVSEEELKERMDNTKQSDLCTIVYTSGTTGRPKGVELTFTSFMVPVDGVMEPWKLLVNIPTARALLFLPVAHALARMINYCLLSGCGTAGYIPNISNLVNDMRTFKPTATLVVPRVLEKIYNGAEAAAGRGIKRRIFKWATYSAIQWGRASETEKGPNLWQTLNVKLARALVLNKIMKMMGGDLWSITCGGAPLSNKIAYFFVGMGITLTPGYGTTETGGPLTMSHLDNIKQGTVGEVWDCDEVRIGDNDEIQARGPSMMRGYHNNPEATKAAFTEDGWYKTGDKGFIDERNLITVTGRIREIIVTAGGKNVNPSLLEERLKGHPLVSQVVVVGDGRPFVGALVTIDSEMLPVWLKNHNLPVMDVTRAIREDAVIKSLTRGIERTNKVVSRAESIRKIKLLTTDFTEENGLLTPSLKVKRHLVEERFAKEIDELYSAPKDKTVI